MLILGYAQTTAAGAASWATSNGAGAWFAALADAYWKLAAARGGVRPEVGYADFAKETDFGRFGGTDPVFSANASMCNPCGLKTADGDATAVFPDWWTGITAHLDHLALYAGAAGYPRQGSPDPRAFPFLHGVCPTVESLGGHWAPATDYGTTLLSDFIVPLLGAAPMLCPFATYKPVQNHGGPLDANLGLVVHVAQGDGSLYGWFNNPSAQASSHFWVGVDGTLEQYVDCTLQAWAEMAGNADYLSVETEGFDTAPFTQAQCDTLARLIAWGHRTFGWPLQLVDHGGSGVTTHAHYPSGQPDPAWGDHPCPGSVRAGQLPSILSAAAALIDPPVPNPPTSHHLKENDMVLANDGHTQFMIYATSNGLRKHACPPGTDVEAIAASGTPNWGSQASLLATITAA